eukprot:CCRYP_018096-RA/>CCRYP_018096-RA protein AED:0.48 eAED:0.48 QI:0/-1/0/1/-1/1/1/0/135
MPNRIEQMETSSQREEAHWSSFREAVASLQDTLLEEIISRSSLDEINTDLFDREQIESRRFDFSGLEKVTGSINSNTNIVSPLNDDANVSRTAASQVEIDALSNAEKRLAETKLLLALVESQRDELEFELMRLKC